MRNASENRLPKGRISLKGGLFAVLMMAQMGLTGDSIGQPRWIFDDIWYQIFPERFQNGDTNNYPTISHIVAGMMGDEFEKVDHLIENAVINHNRVV